jgi:histidinol-phosphate phosphatase family protein
VNAKSQAVFLDRDGVINRDRPDFVKSWEEFEFLPHCLEALAALSRTPYKIVVITNQSGVGRGLLTERTLEQMHAQMIDRVRASGGRIDAIYYCPHAPSIGCDCRKPATGLFLEAARDLNINLTLSWAIGDSHRDAQAANRAGVQAILLDRILPDHSAVPASPLQFVRAADLLEAVRIIQNSSIASLGEAVPA